MQNSDKKQTEPGSDAYHIIIMFLAIVVPVVILPKIIDNAFDTPKALILLLGASLMAGIFCFNYLSGRPTVNQVQPVLKIVISLLITLNLVSLLYTSNLYFTKKAAMLNISCLAIFYFTALHTDGKRAFRIIIAASLSGILVSVIVWLQYFDIYLLITWAQSGSMIMGTIGNSNYVGAYVIFPLFAIAGLACLLKGKMRFITSLLFLFILAALFFARGRSSWLGFIVTFPLFLFIIKNIYGISIRTQITANLYKIIITIIIIVCALIAFNRVAPERFDNSLTFSHIFESETLRLRITKYFPPSIWISKQNPLFGSGLWSYRSMVYKAQAELNRSDSSFFDNYSNPKPRRAHNEFLEIINDGGIVAAVVLAMFFLIIMTHGWTVIKNEEAKLNDRVISAASFCSMIAIMLTALFFFSFRLNTTLFMSVLMMGIMEGIYLRNHKFITIREGRKIEGGALLIAVISLILISILWNSGIKPFMGEIAHFKYKIALAQRDFKNAEKHLVEALEYNPKHSSYNLYAGQLYLEVIKDYSKAGDYIEKAILDFNGDITMWSAYFVKGLVKLRMGSLAEAGNAFEKAIYYNPTFEPAIKELAKVNKVIKSYTGAGKNQYKTP